MFLAPCEASCSATLAAPFMCPSCQSPVAGEKGRLPSTSESFCTLGCSVPPPRWVLSSWALTWCQHLHMCCLLPHVHPCASTPGLLPLTFQTPDQLAGPLATAQVSVQILSSRTVWRDGCTVTALRFGRSRHLCHQGRDRSAAAQHFRGTPSAPSVKLGLCLPYSGRTGLPPSPPGLGRELGKGAGGTRVGDMGFGISTCAAASRLLIWLRLGPRWTFTSYHGPVLGPVSFMSWRVLEDPDHRGQF